MDFKDFDIACEIHREIVYKEMQARIAALESQLDRYRWRRVEDELPGITTPVLVWANRGAVELAFRSPSGWNEASPLRPMLVEPTHWMPMPPAPEEGE